VAKRCDQSRCWNRILGEFHAPVVRPLPEHAVSCGNVNHVFHAAIFGDPLGDRPLMVNVEGLFGFGAFWRVENDVVKQRGVLHVERIFPGHSPVDLPGKLALHCRDISVTIRESDAVENDAVKIFCLLHGKSFCEGVPDDFRRTPREYDAHGAANSICKYCYVKRKC